MVRLRSCLCHCQLTRLTPEGMREPMRRACGATAGLLPATVLQCRADCHQVHRLLHGTPAALQPCSRMHPASSKGGLHL